MIREYPERDARLVVGCPVFGLNPKSRVAGGDGAVPAARDDPDQRLERPGPPILPPRDRRYLAEPGVGLVTNLFAGVEEEHSGAALENLQLNGTVAAGVALASVLRITCVVGKSMLMPVRVLEAIGGFASVRNLLAEDQAIGLRVRKAGYSIRLSHHVIANVNRHRSFRWFLNRHSRWFKIRRRCRSPPFWSNRP